MPKTWIESSHAISCSIGIQVVECDMKSDSVGKKNPPYSFSGANISLLILLFWTPGT